ncbi:MAG: RNA pseudouridine synthase [Clostridia bacterium]
MNITFEDINIAYEDNHLLVVVKPQNIAVCPDSTGDKNLLDLLKEYLIKTYDKAGEAYLGLVHRLDRPTGGVIVYAKTSKAASRLAESMRAGAFEKKYYAVTIGTPKERRAELRDMLYKNAEKNEVYKVPMATDGAKLAVLEYKVLSEQPPLALLEINLITGRSHQARVQLSSIGTPIFGDRKYGGEKMPVGYNLALWAAELRFPHPITREIMLFRVEPPTDEIPWKMFSIPSIL